MVISDIEKEIWQEGYTTIAYCDEVGRGCLFGPVLAAAIILPKGLIIEGIKDSKKLSPKKRLEAYELIMQQAIAIGIGKVHAHTIDVINIKNATRLAMKNAILNLQDPNGNSIKPDFLLIDAEEVNLDIPQKSIVKGDDLIHGIAAASIVAKVRRDALFTDWHKKYPVYGLDTNKGYGTKAHREAIVKYGISDQHRKSFLKKILAHS
ncbi:MAG: ribonuclease HII [Clostridiales bacterium]|nr:ribonuclease HII [Clostridiales bacterium]